MHPFKNFWERFLRDGDSGGSGGTGAGDPGADPMGGEQGVGAGGTNASGSGSNSEGAGNNAGSGAGVGASGSEAPSAEAPENVGVDTAASVGTAPGTAPGTTATSNVGTTTSDTTTSQEDNATVSANVSAAPQGFSSVADAVAAAVDENTQETLANATPAANVSTKGTAQVGTANPNNPSISAEDVAIDNATQQAIANLAEQLGVTPNQMNEMLGTGQVSVDANVSGNTATATATANNTDATSETGGTGSTSGATGQGAPGQGAPSGPTGDATAPGATPGAEAQSPAATEPGTAPAGTQGSGNTGSTEGAFGGNSETGDNNGAQAQGTPSATPQSFSQVASPQSQTSGVTSISDVIAGIANAMNPIGSAQAQVVDPNTGGVGGGQGQQGQVDEEEKSKTSKGKSFGGVAPAPALPGRTIGVTSNYRETPNAPPAPPAPSFQPSVVTPTPPPLPTPGQINAPPMTPGVAQIFGEEPGVPTGTKGFRGVAPAPPPAPALPPSGRAPGMIGPPTAPMTPKGFPGAIGVSPQRSEEIKEQVEAAVAPKTIEQIMNAPPAPVYSRMPALRGPGLIDAIGKNKLGPTSQSGDGTGGPSTPGAQGQAPGVKGQVTSEEEQAPPLSVVPRLPGFGGVSPGPAPAVPSVVPALPLPASITTTQQPTEETMPTATVDKSAPQSFAAALAAANKQMTVKEGMQTIGRLREQAQEILGNPNATDEDQAAAKSYLDRTDAIANPGPMNTAGVAPSVQANQQKQGTAKGIAGNPSVGLIDKSFTNASVNPVDLSTQTNVEASIGKVGSVSGLPGVSTVAGLASRAAGKWGGATQGATLGQEEAAPNTPGATAPWGGDDGFGDTRGDNSGFGRIAGLSSGARLADMGLGGVNSFATIGSDPLFVAQDYGLAGDAFSTLGYSLPGEVDDPRIPEAGRRKTNGFLLRRVA